MSYKRYVVAGIVVIGGIAAAWPFRHNRPLMPTPLAVNHEPAVVVWTHPQDLTLQVHPQSGTSPAPELTAAPNPHNQLARPASFTSGAGSEPPLETFPAPPFLPMAYESLLVPVGSTPRRPSEPMTPVQEPLLPSADEQVPVGEKPGPLWRRHRIVEGDTLAILAQRYYGDAARAGEIHVANLDRLANPEVLPLGVTLLIPPRIETARPTN